MQERSSVDSDPEKLRARVGQATSKVIGTAAALSDSQAREPSLLPGWSRGHVLTHIARNADGLRNLLIWAQTGVETPQYPSRRARDDAISAGSGRPASELAADLRESSEAFLAEAGRLSGSAWQVSVVSLRGPAHPAWVALWKRLSEVELHHVDLDAGYRPENWPDPFVADCLEVVTGVFAGADGAPAALLTDTGTGRSYKIGLTGADGHHRAAAPQAGGPQAGGPQAGRLQVAVAGPGSMLLAWLTGRSDGAGLIAEPGGQLPAVPAW
jgi:maleylpyruvate isomerase